VDSNTGPIYYFEGFSFCAASSIRSSIMCIILNTFDYMNLFQCLWFNATFKFVLHTYYIYISFYAFPFIHFIVCISYNASDQLDLNLLISSILFYASHSIYFILYISFYAF
jgi:hypothetical protein